MHSCVFKMATELLIKTNELQSSTITIRSASTVKVQTVGYNILLQETVL